MPETSRILIIQKE